MNKRRVCVSCLTRGAKISFFCIFLMYMTQTGGKRGTNSALKSWVSFVKKVQKEEKLSYPAAMKRASQRKREWKRSMKGGEPYDDSMTPDGSADDDRTSSSTTFDSETVEDALGEPVAEIDSETTTTTTTDDEDLQGGRRRRRRRTRHTRRSHKGGRSRSRGRTARRSRSRGRGRGKY